MCIRDRLWTNFRVGANTGILDWYTVLTGVIALVTLTAHGALYIAVKTENELSQRVRSVALWAWPVQLVLTIVGLIATLYVRPTVLDNYKQHAVGYLIPVVVFGSLGLMIYACLLYTSASAALSARTNVWAAMKYPGV